MKTLYLECQMGAAGDMLMAALLELHPDQEGFLTRLNALGIPGVKMEAIHTIKCGITGTEIMVKIHGAEEESRDVLHSHWLQEAGPNIQDAALGHFHIPDTDHDHMEHSKHRHTHTGMAEISQIIEALPLPEAVKQDVLAVYGLIAEAEGHAHGKPVTQIHFHEVGNMDAVADIVGVCWLLYELAPEKILASPVHVGSGQVHCAHGILPVPAPATAFLLQGVPAYGGHIQGELCTPTGAALLRHFVSDFTAMPMMQLKQVGYGMGKKDFSAMNCLRALWGEAPDCQEIVITLCCNLDDMTPEAVGFATEQLLAQGALDVYTTAIQMKKNRPGVLLSCLCREEQRETMAALIFQYTTTLGIRENRSSRYILNRTEEIFETDDGPVRIKYARGWGSKRSKIEYEDLARISRMHHISLHEAAERIQRNIHVRNIEREKELP